MQTVSFVVVGGGAAGFFAALAASDFHPNHSILLLEKNRQLLSKVRISGGGRCNVTHACFDPAKLVQYYPRGSAALRSAFSQFQPRDTVRWFEERGVLLKEEADGRMFPITDSSETIVRCFIDQAKQKGVRVLTEQAVERITKLDHGFLLDLGSAQVTCQKLLLATGSNRAIFTLLESLGHTIQPPVPSLFTFNIDPFPLKEIAGISVKQVALTILDTALAETGPLLITHWGFSGPSVLRLSAWGARTLHEKKYHATLEINWLVHHTEQSLKHQFETARQTLPKKLVSSPLFQELPHNLWKALLAKRAIEGKKFADLSNKEIHDLVQLLQKDRYFIKGQTTFKEEFVTCGGVTLDEVNMKRMESKHVPGLFFAGEILDIDGITGGFNFQNAWTTGWIAGKSIAF